MNRKRPPLIDTLKLLVDTLKINIVMTCHYDLDPSNSYFYVVICSYSGVSVTFQFMCVHIIFSSVSVAEWPPFGK